MILRNVLKISGTVIGHGSAWEKKNPKVEIYDTVELIFSFAWTILKKKVLFLSSMDPCFRSIF